MKTRRSEPVLGSRLTLVRRKGQVLSAKDILYCGKLDRILGTPLGTAKLIAEEIRTNPPVGWRLLAQEVDLRRNVKGYLPQMMQKLGEYLENQQPLFDEVDYKIVDIVNQHPELTIKEITSELSKQFPERKWDALTRCVQRLVKDVR
jgi:hypothetical protein